MTDQFRDEVELLVLRYNEDILYVRDRVNHRRADNAEDKKG